MNGMNLPPGFNFDNIPENDLNQVWKILTQLQTSNPKKYRDFIDHVKLEEEKREKLSKIVPLPHSVLGLISPTLQCRAYKMRHTVRKSRCKIDFIGCKP